ncbi:hypothetical protein X975_00593, partial [Stegodyphus mimosarum]
MFSKCNQHLNNFYISQEQLNTYGRIYVFKLLLLPLSPCRCNRHLNNFYILQEQLNTYGKLTYSQEQLNTYGKLTA